MHFLLRIYTMCRKWRVSDQCWIFENTLISLNSCIPCYFHFSISSRLYVVYYNYLKKRITFLFLGMKKIKFITERTIQKKAFCIRVRTCCFQLTSVQEDEDKKSAVLCTRRCINTVCSMYMGSNLANRRNIRATNDHVTKFNLSGVQH